MTSFASHRLRLGVATLLLAAATPIGAAAAAPRPTPTEPGGAFASQPSEPAPSNPPPSDDPSGSLETAGSATASAADADHAGGPRAVEVAGADDDVEPVPSDLTAVEADRTGDGVVDDLDVRTAQLDWRIADQAGTSCTLGDDARSDVDGDGCVDADDLDLIAGAADPEPTAQRAAEPDAPPLVVDTTDDHADADATDGVCATVDGACSLRAAITTANANPGPDEISFAIPGTGTHRIHISGALPTIVDRSGGVTIDGYTQPGATPNTHPLESDATITIELVGRGVLTENEVLTIASGRNTLRGLAIYNAEFPVIVIGDDAVENRFVGNFFGTDASGTVSLDNGDAYGGKFSGGLWFYDGAARNIVGTPALADRNVFGGPLSFGIQIEHRSNDIVIQNNIIGLGPRGGPMTMDRPIDLQWFVEGTIVGGSAPFEHNVAGGGLVGIDISHSVRRNTIIGNYFGPDLTGDATVPHAANRIGVSIKDSSTGNLITQNVMSGNEQFGLYGKQNYTERNDIIDNLIGVGVRGAPLGNGLAGIGLNGIDHRIERNVIAHNGGPAIVLFDSYPDDGNNYSEPGRTRHNRIRDNVFFANDGLSNDIFPLGINPNDVGDADASTQDFLNHPETTSVTNGRLVGTACASCTIDVYLGDATGKESIRIATFSADPAGRFDHTSAAVAAAPTITLAAIDPAGNTSEFSPPVASSPTRPTTALALDPLADQRSAQGEAVTVPLAAAVHADPGVRVAYAASPLPAGLTLDRTTGVISGAPTQAGERSVLVFAFDGTSMAHRRFTWTIGNTGFRCRIDPATYTLTWENGQAGPAYVGGIRSDGSKSYLGASETNTIRVDELTPLFEVHYFTDGHLSTACTNDAAFTCTVDGAAGSVRWHNGQTGTAYVGRIDDDGTSTYTGPSDTGSIAITDITGTYEVHYFTRGHIQTTCRAA